MKHYTVLLLAVGFFVGSLGRQCYSDNPVHVSVYYETLCPYSKAFITDQLYPVFQQIPYNIALELIPYGNAETIIQSNGSFAFKCQHGSKECKGNIIHACAMHLYNNASEAIDFIYCVAKAKNGFKRSSKCARENKLSWTRIEQCANSELGDNLHFKNGEKTQNLDPALKGVPSIIINNKYNEKNDLMSQEHLMNLLCKITNRNLPIDCANLEKKD